MRSQAWSYNVWDKNRLDRINRRLHIAKENNSELEDVAVEPTQDKTKEEKVLKQWKEH